MKFKPHNYQLTAVDHILDNEASALFMEMGLGKTTTTLTAIDILMFEEFEVNKVLVIAPKVVALSVWPSEVKKWDHLKHLKLSVIAGNQQQRIDALKAKAHVYVIGVDNVAWLMQYYSTGMPYDMWVIDELSKFKNQASQRFKALKVARPLVKRVVGLTGTPSPNSVAELWPQMYLLDQGERLGKTITAFREAYLRPEVSKGHHVYKYGASKENTKLIHRMIGDICISMKAEDYLDLPPVTVHDVVLDLSDKLLRDYKVFEKTKVLELIESRDNKEISAVSAGVLCNKLLQYASGTIYDDDRQVEWLHDAKIEALEELLDEAGSQPVLIFYAYDHGLKRIQKKFNVHKLRTQTEQTVQEDIAAWNAGKIKRLICHPRSAGHGLNLQDGGSIIIWFGLTWSLEDYLQANARLARQGQKKPVNIYRILCNNTIDLRVAATLSDKDANQQTLMAAVKAIVKNYEKEAGTTGRVFQARQSMVRAKKLRRA